MQVPEVHRTCKWNANAVWISNTIMFPSSLNWHFLFEKVLRKCLTSFSMSRVAKLENDMKFAAAAWQSVRRRLGANFCNFLRCVMHPPENRSQRLGSQKERGLFCLSCKKCSHCGLFFEILKAVLNLKNYIIGIPLLCFAVPSMSISAHWGLWGDVERILRLWGPGESESDSRREMQQRMRLTFSLDPKVVGGSIMSCVNLYYMFKSLVIPASSKLYLSLSIWHLIQSMYVPMCM